MKKGQKVIIIGFYVCAILLSGIFLALSGLLQNGDEEYVPSAATIGYSEVLTVENVSGKAKNQADIINPSEKNIGKSETTFSGNIKIDINKATSEELQLIDGIGPVLAEKIVRYRDEHGDFSSMSDLLNVKGIGNSKLEKIKLHAYIDGEDIQKNQDEKEKKSIETLAPESREEQTEAVEALWGEPKESDNIQVRYPLELNSATAEQFMTIKGIGEKTAARIVLYAKTYGFYSVEDLMEVEGIGKSTYEQIKAYVCVDTSKLPNPSKEQTSVTTSAATTETTKYAPKLPIELNNASMEDLIWIDGIGQTLAIRIIAYGQQNGYYKVDDLLKVKGIGQSKFNAIKGYLCVDTSAFPKQTTASTDTTTYATTETTNENDGKFNLNPLV